MHLVYRVLSLVLLAGTATPASCLAQAYPSKPVRVIVAFPPGGSNDIVARLVFQKMSELTGQQHVIDNRGGAAGVIGASLAAQSPPDGYTIMVHSATHISNAHLRKLPYDTLGDFSGVTPLAQQVFMLVVHPSLPVNSPKDLAALAKQRPGQIFYGSGGNGTPLHLAMALFASLTETKMVHVQYKGAAAAAIALLSGEAQASIANIGVALPYVRTKRLRVLGVTSKRRLAHLPQVPSIAEVVPGYDFTAWVGAFVPGGVPKPILDKLNADLGKVLADPGIKTNLGSQTLDPMHMPSDSFARFLKSEYEKYGKLIRSIGARSD